MDERKAARAQMIPIEELEGRDFHNRAKSWLKNRLSKRSLGVEQSFLFGSIVHEHYSTSDVDLCVVLKAAKEKRLKQIGQKLKSEVALDFKRTFGHSLHVSFLIINEQNRLANFLAKAGKHERLD